MEDKHLDLAADRINEGSRRIVIILDRACALALACLEMEQKTLPRDRRHDDQAFPMFVRYFALRQLAADSVAYDEQGKRIILQSPFNLSINFEMSEANFRMYKQPKQGRLKPRSAAMYRFMTQEEFEQKLKDPQMELLYLFPETEEEAKSSSEPCPNIGIIWDHTNYRLNSVLFIVPHGLDEKGDISILFQKEFTIDDFVTSAADISAAQAPQVEDEEELLVSKGDDEEAPVENDPRTVEPSQGIPQSVSEEEAKAAEKSAQAFQPDNVPSMEEQEASKDEKGRGN